MTHFTLPTPQDVDYNQDALIEHALERIKSAINQRVFSFRPEPNWIFSQMERKLALAIHPFGWTIETHWNGSKNDGYQTWLIKPL